MKNIKVFLWGAAAGAVVVFLLLRPEQTVPPSTPADDVSSLPTYKTFADQAHRAQLLALATTFKPMVVQHYSMEGRFPQRWSDLQIDEETLHSRDVKQVLLRDGEVILIPARIADGWLSLTPTVSMGGLTVDWDCRTNIDVFVDELCKADERVFP